VDTRMTFGRPGMFLVALPASGAGLSRQRCGRDLRARILATHHVSRARDPGGDFQEDATVAH
jgi:hypothetical protein